MATDLPEPVVPAISRCGMRARSTITGSPPMVLPRQSGSLAGVLVVVVGVEQLAQIDLLALVVRQFDADGVAARHHGDARRQRAHRAGDVVGKPDHARRLDAGRGLELVERDHRAGPRVDDLAAHAEILQHAFERRGGLLDRFRARREAVGWLAARRAASASAADSRRSSAAARLRAARLARGAAPARPPRPRPRHRRRRLGRRASSARLDAVARRHHRRRRAARRCGACSAERRVTSRTMRALRLSSACTSQPSEIEVRSSSSSSGRRPRAPSARRA